MPEINSAATQANSAVTGQGEWFGLGAADWSVFANIATILEVFIALFGGYVALRTYRNANKLASHAHMHGLFRDYLHMQVEFELAMLALDSPAAANAAALEARRKAAEKRVGKDVAPLKLYVLEEMYAWLKPRTRRRDDWTWWPFPSQRKQANKAWAATILSHVVTDKEEVVENLVKASHCYGTDFLKFLAEGLSEHWEFEAIHAHQKALEDSGERVAMRTLPVRAGEPANPREQLRKTRRAWSAAGTGPIR